MKNGGCPDVLASTIALAVEPRRGNSRHENVVFTSVKPLEFRDPTADFQRVCTFFEVDDKYHTFWHKKLNEHRDKHQQYLLEKLEQNVSVMNEKNKRHGTLKLAMDIRFQVGGPLSPFDIEVTEDCTPFLHIGQEWAASSQLQNHPLIGAASFWTVIVGYFHVTCVPIAAVVEQDGQLDNIMVFLEKVGENTVLKWNSFGVSAGTSFFTPAGTVPLMVGVCKTNENAGNYFAVAQYPILDQGSVTSMEKHVASEVKAIMGKTLSRSFKNMTHRNTEAIEKWLTLFPADANKENSEEEAASKKS